MFISSVCIKLLRMTINCNGKLISLDSPLVMGILNLTPDSFHDGGRYESTTAMLQHVEKMVSEGADIIDIGGMSSKPGSPVIPVEEELRRVIEPVRLIHER